MTERSRDVCSVRSRNLIEAKLNVFGMIRNDRIRQLPKHVNKACANELMNSVQRQLTCKENELL